MAVDPLVEALKDKDWNVRNWAAKALGQIGEVRAIQPLVQAAGDQERRIQESAITALGGMGKPAVDLLIQILQNANYSAPARGCAADALGTVGDARAVQPLIETLKDRQIGLSNAWASVAWALVKIGNEETRTALRQTLAEELKRAFTFKDKVEMVRILESLHWEPRDDTEKAHYLITKKKWDELFGLRKQAVEALIEALSYADEADVPEKAAEILGKIRDSRAVRPLILELRDRNWKVRKTAAWALGQIADEEAREPLERVVEEDEEQSVRYEASGGLIHIANKKLGEHYPRQW